MNEESELNPPKDVYNSRTDRDRRARPLGRSAGSKTLRPAHGSDPRAPHAEVEQPRELRDLLVRELDDFLAGYVTGLILFGILLVALFLAGVFVGN